MTNVEKNLNQAMGYQLEEDFEALPLTGPGRWADIPGGRLYTNDDKVLFLQGDGSPADIRVFLALDQAFKSGQSATEAFNRLIGDAIVTSGDLSELA